MEIFQIRLTVNPRFTIGTVVGKFRPRQCDSRNNNYNNDVLITILRNNTAVVSHVPHTNHIVTGVHSRPVTLDHAAWVK